MKMHGEGYIYRVLRKCYVRYAMPTTRNDKKAKPPPKLSVTRLQSTLYARLGLCYRPCLLSPCLRFSFTICLLSSSASPAPLRPLCLEAYFDFLLLPLLLLVSEAKWTRRISLRQPLVFVGPADHQSSAPGHPSLRTISISIHNSTRAPRRHTAWPRSRPSCVGRSRPTPRAR
jgi:hypothetical protein